MIRSLSSATAILLFALVNITTLPQMVKAQDSNVEQENFTVSLKSCDRSGKIIKCNLLLTSKKNFNISVRGGRIFDRFGNEYNPAWVQVGNTRNNGQVGVVKQLLKGIPTKLILTFNEIPPEVKEIAVLEIRRIDTEFRDIILK